LPAIRVRDLRKSYGAIEAVRGVDFDVEEGEVFGFLGPNGAGKTTIVEILEGYRQARPATCQCSATTRPRASGPCVSGSASCCRRPAWSAS